MALKQKYSNKAEVPAEHAALYVERGGAWTLDAEPDARIDEFRQSNIGAQREIAD